MAYTILKIPLRNNNNQVKIQLLAMSIFLSKIYAKEINLAMCILGLGNFIVAFWKYFWWQF